ncbi:MAG: lipopolysaccharide biosynthesis protein [Aestuariivirga sp.]
MSIARRLFTTSAIMFAGRLFGAGVMFAVQAGIARLMGAESLGQYAVAVSAMNLACVALPLGFAVVANYFAPEYASRGQGAPLRRFFKQASLQALGLGVLAFFLGPPILRHMGGVAADLAEHWQPVALTAIALSFLTLTGAIIIAFKRPIVALTGDGIARPLIVAAAFGLAYWYASADRVLSLLWFSCIGTAVLAAVFVWIAWRYIIAVPPVEATDAEPRRWWHYALPWALLALVGDYFFDLDLLMLSRQLPYEQLAVFGVTTRLFSLAAFGVTAVYSISLPHLFEAEVKGLPGALVERIQHTNIAATGTAVAMLLGTIIVAPFVFTLMGPAFAKATGPLAILCAALLIRSIFGPGALILSMAQKPYLPLIPMAIGLVAALIGNAVLVPIYGLYGATISAAFALSVWAAALWFITLKLTGSDVSIFPALFARKQ